MLVGILNWIVYLGRFDIWFVTSSLSQFTACLREGHLKRMLRVYVYLKIYPILTGSKDDLEKDYTNILKDQYPDDSKDFDVNLLDALIDELEVTALVDLDDAHDTVTWKSVAELILLIGHTPVFFISKGQDSNESSTSGAEFVQ